MHVLPAGVTAEGGPEHLLQAGAQVSAQNIGENIYVYFQIQKQRNDKMNERPYFIFTINYKYINV